MNIKKCKKDKYEVEKKNDYSSYKSLFIEYILLCHPKFISPLISFSHTHPIQTLPITDILKLFMLSPKYHFMSIMMYDFNGMLTSFILYVRSSHYYFEKRLRNIKLKGKFEPEWSDTSNNFDNSIHERLFIISFYIFTYKWMLNFQYNPLACKLILMRNH